MATDFGSDLRLDWIQKARSARTRGRGARPRSWSRSCSCSSALSSQSFAASQFWRQGKRTGAAPSRAELELFEERGRAHRAAPRRGRACAAATPGRAGAAPRLSRAPAGARSTSLEHREAPDALAAGLPARPMRRVAAVDLGTNSTRLLVADVDGDTLDEVLARLTITRLGEGVDERRRLLPVADRASPQLPGRVPARAREPRRARERSAIATSAVRDAENGEAFLGEIEWSYGFTTRLLDGHRGSRDDGPRRHERTARARATSLLVDIGGGSTELVLSPRTATLRSRRASTSAACGSPSASSAPIRRRRLSSRPQAPTFARFSPSSRRRARSASPARSRPLRRSTSATTGTTRLERTATTSASHAVETRARTPRRDDARGATSVPGIEPGRAPVIVAGIVVLREMMTHTDSRRSRRPSGTSCTAPRSPPRSCPSPRRALRLPAPTPAADPAYAACASTGRRAERWRRSRQPRAAPSHRRSGRARAAHSRARRRCRTRPTARPPRGRVGRPRHGLPAPRRAVARAAGRRMRPSRALAGASPRNASPRSISPAATAIAKRLEAGRRTRQADGWPGRLPARDSLEDARRARSSPAAAAASAAIVSPGTSTCGSPLLARGGKEAHRRALWPSGDLPRWTSEPARSYASEYLELPAGRFPLPCERPRRPRARSSSHSPPW